MTPAELKTAIQSLGLPSGYALALLIGVKPRTVQKWLTGQTAVPEPVIRLLRILVEIPKARALM